MSENLSILDGELRRQFAPVDRLSVDNQGGGVSPWVVSDFLDISTLSVSENGLYLAAEEEYDCYEEVEVDISEELGEGDYRRITGKDPNLDPNNDYAAGLDENGNLTKEMIPAAIHIVVPPRKLKYEEGEMLDFTGIHVYLMDGNNQRYTDDNYPTGEIPFDELIFPITIAEGGGDSIKHATSELDITPLVDVPFSGGFTRIGTYTGGAKLIRQTYTVSGNAVISYGERDVSYICASSDPNAIVTIHDHNEEVATGDASDNFKSVELTSTYSHEDKTVYFRYGGNIFGALTVESINTTCPVDFSNFSDSDKGKIAWTMIYGNVTEDEEGIPVQWMRSDGIILEDKFTIEVGESEEGEDQPDPWAGSADVSWGGHHYNLNRRIVPEVHYANGYCWQEGTSEYTVEQAASMGWLILIR